MHASDSHALIRREPPRYCRCPGNAIADAKFSTAEQNELSMKSLLFMQFLRFSLNLPPAEAGVDTEENDKGRILGACKAMLRVFLEILPLQTSKEKRRKNDEKLRKT